MRLAKIRIKGRFNKITIISAYAPTEDNKEENKDEFYNKLAEICERTSKHDTLIAVDLLAGDFNAKIGREDYVRGIAGKYSLHDETSENGIKLCQLTAENGQLKIKSVNFPHKEIHKGTWKFPGSEQVNQTDHMLIDKRHFAISILDVRTRRGADGDSDYFMVRIILRSRIYKGRRKKKEPNGTHKR